MSSLDAIGRWWKIDAFVESKFGCIGHSLATFVEALFFDGKYPLVTVSFHREEGESIPYVSNLAFLGLWFFSSNKRSSCRVEPGGLTLAKPSLQGGNRRGLRS